MKSLLYSLSLIAFVLLIANPLSLWAGTDEEEALRIEKGGIPAWRTGHETNQATLAGLCIFEDVKTDDDIDFITACTNIRNLTIIIDEKYVGKLAKLSRLEKLDLHRSSLQGDSLAQLAGLTNLHTLEIEDCQLSAKAYESLGSLDHIKTLKVNLRDLLDARNIESLSQMQSLRNISTFEFELWHFTKAEREQLANDLARIQVELVGHYGEPLDPKKTEPPPDYHKRIPRYSPFQLNVLTFAWKVTPWLGWFSLIVMVVSLFIWRSRAQWTIRAHALLRKFARFGYVMTLGFVLIVLTMITPRKPYQEQTSATTFLDMIFHGISETNAIGKLPPLIIGQRHCFYPVSSDRSHPWRGQTLCAVSNQEILDHFPRFLEKALQQEKLSDLQMGALLGLSVSTSNRTEVIQKLRGKGAHSLAQPQTLRQYLTAVEWERLSSYNGCSGSEAFFQRLELEKGAAYWEERTQHYWATATFEVAYFCLLLSVFWVPLLTPRLFRFAYRFWAILPLLLVAPYQMGYCWLADSPFGACGQGILYPVILDHCLPLFYWPIPLTGWFELPVVGAVERLNQPVVFPGLWIQFSTCAIGAVIISLAAWFSGRWLMKKAFPVKRTEGELSSEQEKPVTPQEGATDKPDLQAERSAE